jgi:hypothetical protein
MQAVHLSIAPIQMGRLPFLQGEPESLSGFCAAREPNKAIAREIS